MHKIFTPFSHTTGDRALAEKCSDLVSQLAWGKTLTILSISLFNTHFKALSIVNNQIQHGWEHPQPVRTPNELRQAMETAIHETQFPGKDLSILVDDDRFIQRTLHLPPMPLPDLLSILGRKAQQEKTWEGPAAWRYRLGIEARGKRHVHVEIWPQDFIDELVMISQDVGLRLRQLAPISILSESQLSTLPVEPGEATLLITLLDGKITLVVGREDGPPLLTRHLLDWKEGLSLGERIATEANRTLMYVNQQTHMDIQQIWLLAEEHHLSLDEIQAHISTPILPSPVAPDWKYWLWVGATLPINHPSNFTPAKVIQAPLRSSLTRSAAALVALLLIISVGTSTAITAYLAKHLDHVHATAQRVSSLQEEQARWQHQLVTLQNQETWTRTILNPTSPPLEGPFLGYLGQVIPSQIILHKAAITRAGQGWNVELSGVAQGDLSQTLQTLNGLVTTLGESPYHVAFQPDWRDHLLTQTAQMPSQEPGVQTHRFTLTGGLR